MIGYPLVEIRIRPLGQYRKKIRFSDRIVEEATYLFA